VAAGSRHFQLLGTIADRLGRQRRHSEYIVDDRPGSGEGTPMRDLLVTKVFERFESMVTAAFSPQRDGLG